MRPARVLGAALAGLSATLVIEYAADWLYAHENERAREREEPLRQEMPTTTLARRTAKLLGRELDDEQAEQVETISHYAFRASGGLAAKLLAAIGVPRVNAALGVAVAMSVVDVRHRATSDRVFYDDQDRVIGFNGLAVVEMTHRFAVAGHELWAWCAWDTLFLPELIGQEAHVSSTCPVTGAEVTLTVGPAGVRDLNQPGAVVSFLVPDKPFATDILQSFCHFVHFFASRAAGDAWTNEHEGTFLLSVDDAYELGQRTNRAQFGDALPASPTIARR